MVVLCLFLVIIQFSFSQQKSSLGAACVIPDASPLYDDAGMISETLLTSLYNYGSDQYRFVARDKRDILLLEQYSAIQGTTELKKELAESRFEFPDAMAIASFSTSGGIIHVGIQIVDTLSNEVYGSTVTKIENLRELEPALDAAAARLFGKEVKINALPTTIFSGLVPGTGQMINGSGLKGGLMLGGAAAAAAGSVISFILYSVDYEESLHATNKTNTDYYYQRAMTDFIAGGLFAGVYMVLGIWSAVDNVKLIREKETRY